MNIYRYSATLVIALTAACSPRSPEFNPARITEDVRMLSSDEFEGRAPAGAGEKKTVDYLVSRLTAAGLSPGGDVRPEGRAWTQDVPLIRSAIQGDRKSVV